MQALGLMAGGADYLLLETAQDTRNIKAGLIGIERAGAQAGWRLPVAVSDCRCRYIQQSRKPP